MEDRDQVQKILDESALCVVTMEPDDIQALGNILNNFDAVCKIVQETAPKAWLDLCAGLKGVAEKMALFEVDSPSRALDELGKGISLLQETQRAVEEDAGEIERLCAFLRECPYTDSTMVCVEPWATGPEPAETEDQSPPLDLSQDRELIESFIQESMEHLSTIEIHVLELEKEPDNLQLVDAIFRPFHTIKGVSGFLNLREINKLAHQIETVLDDARSKKISVSPSLVDIVLDGVDLVTRLIDDVDDRLKTGRLEPEYLELGPFLERLHTVGEGVNAPLEDGEEENIPEGDGLDVGELLVKKGVVQAEDLEEALAKQASGESKGKKIGEILIEGKKAKARDVAQALRKQKADRQPAKAAGGNGAGFIKVDTLKLDNMVDMVGELVINEAVLKQRLAMAAGKDRDLAGDLAQLGRITSEIQRIAMSMRMIPMKNTFQKMIRLVRDLASKAGKKVNLEMMGEDTEIDRNVVDMIYDPLVHMVRNSADHGIEIPKDRLAAGKPEAGTIILNAYHKGGNMIIEVTDDGRGLDKEALTAKAMEKGLIQSAEGMSDQDIFGLIFHPGFSTAKKVTDVSGRGVGMDVVKGVLDKLRGKVEVMSRKGQGTSILLKLPLTLAVIDGIIVRAGEQSYVIPTISVLESIRPNREDCHTVVNKGEMIKIRGSLYPLIRLHELFDFPPNTRDPWDAIVVIAESEGKQKCILVDEILGKQEVVIKSLSAMLKNVVGLAGGAILANGRVGMILDVAGLFSLVESQAEYLTAS
ncbi:chemotaxis protein CheA [Desulfatibacillum aliphaticivorans]|uniref:chemotaxis protein CheA n=1 Tax=Desulfatibacillum aliphaticivorans TaxID=218208 RepID=UPI00040C75ED|nr:chemotaxis protein CheA [Desulfatibacillum aliphaticivorans]